jgi:hypothetical protein
MPCANVDLPLIFVDTALPNGEDSEKEDTEHRPAPRFDTPLRGDFYFEQRGHTGNGSFV